MLVVATSTMALVIVLSIFNGLEGLLRNLYGSFDAQITVLSGTGKSFEYSNDLQNQIERVPGIEVITEVIEDNALIRYRGAQRVVRLKGVGESFLDQGRFNEALSYGPMQLKDDSVGFAIIGRGIQYSLGVNLTDDFYPLQIFYPRDIGPGQLNPDKMFTLKQILPGSVFAIEKYFDDNYVFVPLEFSKELMSYGDKRTSLEIAIRDGERNSEVIADLSETLGAKFTIKSNDQIHGNLYKILKWEKIFVFLTFGIILAIGSINIFFSLSMLVIDKKKDLAVLKALGAPSQLLQKTFLLEGCLIAFSGAFIGLGLGLSIAWLQQELGLISMGIPGTISDAYPVKIEILDVALTAMLVIVITIIASISPARKAAKSLNLHLLQ